MLIANWSLRNWFGRVIRMIAFLSFDILIIFPSYGFTLSLIMRA